MQFLEQFENFIARLGIERARGLVGEDQIRFIHDGSRDRNALPRHRTTGGANDPRDGLIPPVRERQAPVAGSRARRRCSSQAATRRFPSAGTSQQCRELKHEADLTTTHRARIFREATRFLPAETIATGIRPFQQPEQAHQCGFARTRSAYDRNKFAAVDRDRHIRDCRDYRRADAIFSQKGW